MPDDPKPTRKRRVTLKDPSRAWQDRPDLVRSYVECINDYSQLGAEVAYILEKRMKTEGIKFASVSHRGKSLESFLEKLTRKPYQDPFSEVTDLAGVRVVCLYGPDLAKVEEIITNEFNVVEKVDKLTELEADRFGYGAVHFIVNLGKHSLGARYDDLHGLACEIQTRTVLQDAWAIIQHHLEYKNESDIPTPLRRQLHGLAAVFEMADEKFEQIRRERESYIASVREGDSNSPSLLGEYVNLDSLRAFVEWRFPGFQSTAMAMGPDWVLHWRRSTCADIKRLATWRRA